MASKWYGSVINRLMENSKDPEIVVGMGVTECFWSDREPYEVIAVKDQKHITIRALDHRRAGTSSLDSMYDNDWELFSNEDNIPVEVVKRGKYWYSPYTYTDAEGKEHTKFIRKHFCFGVAEYYYDWSF